MRIGLVLLWCADGAGATVLARTSSPAGVADVQWDPQPEFQLRDAGGAAVSNSGTVVTLTLTQGPAALSGGLTAAAEPPEFSRFVFGTVAAPTPGVYEVTATARTSGGVVASVAVSVTVSARTPTSLLLLTNRRVVGASGGLLVPQPSVRLVDGSQRTAPDALASCAIGPSAGSAATVTASTVSAGGADAATCSFSDVAVKPQGTHTLDVVATVASGGQLRTSVEVQVATAREFPTQAVLVGAPRAVAGGDFFAPIALRLVGDGQADAPDDASASLQITSTPPGASITGVLTAAIDVTKTQLSFDGFSASHAGTYFATAVVTLSTGKTLPGVPLAFQVSEAVPEPTCVCQLRSARGRPGAPLESQPLLALSTGCADARCGGQAPYSNASATLTVVSGPARGVLAGATEVRADALGRFAFGGVSLSLAGDYVLVARVRLGSGRSLPDLRITAEVAENDTQPLRVVQLTVPRSDGRGVPVVPSLEVALLGADAEAVPGAAADVRVTALPSPTGAAPTLAGNTTAVPTDDQPAAAFRYRFPSLSIVAGPGVWLLDVAAVLSSGGVLHTAVTVVVGGAAPPARSLTAVPPPTGAVATSRPDRYGGDFVPLRGTLEWLIGGYAGEATRSGDGAECTASIRSVLGTPAGGAAGTASAVASDGRCRFPNLGAQAHGAYQVNVAVLLRDGITRLESDRLAVTDSCAGGDVDPAEQWWFWLLLILVLVLAAVAAAAVYRLRNTRRSAGGESPLEQQLLERPSPTRKRFPTLSNHERAAVRKPQAAAAAAAELAPTPLPPQVSSVSVQTDLHWDVEWPDPAPPRSGSESPRSGSGPPSPVGVDRVVTWSLAPAEEGSESDSGSSSTTTTADAMETQRQDSPPPPQLADDGRPPPSPRRPSLAASPADVWPGSSEAGGSEAVAALDAAERQAQRMSTSHVLRHSLGPATDSRPNLFSAPVGVTRVHTEHTQQFPPPPASVSPSLPPQRRSVSLLPSADDTWPQLGPQSPPPRRGPSAMSVSPLPTAHTASASASASASAAAKRWSGERRPAPEPWLDERPALQPRLDQRRREALHAFAAERASVHSRRAAPTPRSGDPLVALSSKVDDMATALTALQQRQSPQRSGDVAVPQSPRSGALGQRTPSPTPPPLHPRAPDIVISPPAADPLPSEAELTARSRTVSVGVSSTTTDEAAPPAPPPAAPEPFARRESLGTRRRRRAGASSAQQVEQYAEFFPKARAVAREPGRR